MSTHYDYADSLFYCPLDANPFALTSKLVFESHSNQLPNLGSITLLVPNASLIPKLRQQLNERTKTHHLGALLGPEISTLAQWLTKFSNSNKKVISPEFGLALLVSEIKKFKWLYGNNNPWYFAEDLLQLFNDLSHSRIQLPTPKDDFLTFLSNAYGAPNRNQKIFLKEAELIHTLWEAWQQQLDALNFYDRSTFHGTLLHESLNQLPNDDMIYLVGYNQLSPIEDEWVSELLKRKQLKIIRYGYSSSNHHISSLGLIDCVDSNNSSTPISQYYHHCFDHQCEPIYQRINRYKQNSLITVPDHLQLLPCDSAEKHALGIYLSVKKALANKHKHIGIITEDRLVARRVRALLERENIALNDISGWALSTTYASTVIDNWLQCLEEDFPYQPFLDLLKSRFISLFDNRNNYLELIYRFEQDIILHENISNGLDRYINALERRSQSLGLWKHNDYLSLLGLLKQLKSISKRFSQSILNTSVPLSEIVLSVKLTVDELTLSLQLQKDPAGKLILDLIEGLLQSSKDISGNFNWLDFRVYYGRLLESHHFLPSSKASNINILNLEQSYMLEFDSVILAAADANHFPGKSISHTFFNDRVRTALELSNWKDKIDYKAFLFRALLERNQNKNIIISWQSQNKSEPIAASPWVAALENFHAACFDVSLLNNDLKNLVDYYASHNMSLAHQSSNLSLSTQPKPISNVSLSKRKMSVSAHQRIINCPYQFFANDILKLKASDEIRETLQKSDFGNRIHLCLHAFFTNEKNLPGPFLGTVTTNNRGQAIELLNEISKKVFSKDIEDNFQHRSWLHKWLTIVPSFIDNEIERQQTWKNQSTEQTVEREINTTLLYGRIDRIDADTHGTSTNLIDYKTGIAPSISNIEHGEDVQLSSYALMLENVTQIEYLQLDSNGKLKSIKCEEESLTILKQSLLARTEAILKMVEAGHELPAWPDKDTCSYCSFIGLCRYPNWQRTVSSDQPTHQ